MLTRYRSGVAASAALAILAAAAAYGAHPAGFRSPRLLAPRGTENAFTGVGYSARGTALFWFFPQAGPLAARGPAVYEVRRSHGGPRTRPIRLLTLPGGGDYPDVGFDGRGHALVAWVEAPPPTGNAQPRYSVHAAVQQIGFRFGPAQQLSQPGHVTSTPSVAVNRSGGAAVAWFEQFPDGWFVRVAVRRPYGNLEPAASIAGPISQGGTATVAINDAGTIVVAWGDSNAGGVGATTGSIDGGFRPAQVLSPVLQARFPAVAIGAGGRAVVAWQTTGQTRDGTPLFRLHAALAEPGEPLGPDTPLGATITPAEEFRPTAAVNPAGLTLVAVDAGPRGVLVFRAPPEASFRATPQRLPVANDADNASLAVSSAGFAIGYTDILPFLPSANRERAILHGALAPPSGIFGRPRTITPSGQEAIFPTAARAPNGDGAIIWTASEQGFANGDPFGSYAL
jgi:hypothetical protein